jgi:hypothetical protein
VKGGRWDGAVTAMALGLVVLAVAALLRGEAGIERSDHRAGETPVSVFRAAQSEGPAPVVVVAHGFAGSRRLMDPLALALAGRGYVVVTFDFLGHGRHPHPMTGDLGLQEGAASVLAAQTREVVDWALALPGVDGRLATAGHSMATNILVLHAQADPRVEAMVGISTFAPTIEAGSPPNLLLVTGALEGRLEAEARRVVAETSPHASIHALPGAVPDPSPGARPEASLLTPDQVEPLRTYGSLAEGTARQLAVAPWVEHVGVLYSRMTLEASARWLDAAFGAGSRLEEAYGRGQPRGQGRGLWILLLLGGVLLLARGLIPFLPRVASAGGPGGAGPSGGTPPSPSWKRLTLVAGVPALATPLLLAPIPTDFLPVIVADYVAVHFGVFGLLTATLLWWTGGRPGMAEVLERSGLQGGGWKPVAGGTALCLGFFLFLVAAPFDRFFTAFVPSPARIPLFLAVLAGTLPCVLADEWLTRGRGVRRGGYAWTKVLLLVSLGIAVALDFEALFFLLIIVPLVVAFFVVHGVWSGWIHRATGSPLVAGLANAVAFAWALSVTFPFHAGP